MVNVLSFAAHVVTDDPLRLLLLFAWLFAAWDCLIALKLPAHSFVCVTLAILFDTNALWTSLNPFIDIYAPLVRWVSREEMKRRIALRARVDSLHARLAATITRFRRIRLVAGSVRTLRRASSQGRSKLAQEIADLDLNLDRHLLRLFERSLPCQGADELHEKLVLGLAGSQAGGTGIDSTACDDNAETISPLEVVEYAWRDFLNSSRHNLAQAYSFLRLRIEVGPLTGILPASVGQRDGWELMFHRLLLNAHELLEERWQIIRLPGRLLGHRIGRWQATFALILLSLLVCVARRIYIGSIFSWPVWETVVFLLFKRTQLAPCFRLDPTVEEKGTLFVAAAIAAILSPRFATVDVSDVAIQLIRWHAISRPLQSAEADLHDAILDAVLARNELKQRMRELRDDKREAGSLRRSD